MHADTRAHIHTPTSAVGSLFGTRACSPGASPGWSGTQAACGSHYESGSYKRTDWRDTGSAGGAETQESGERPGFIPDSAGDLGPVTSLT